MALETTATFIGHNECYGLSEDKLKEAIRELIENGVTDFLSGGQGGFDRMCVHCVYELKKEYPHINNYPHSGKALAVLVSVQPAFNIGLDTASVWICRYWVVPTFRRCTVKG